MTTVVPRPRLAVASYAGGGNYFAKVQDTAPDYLIGYWPLWDLSGTAAEELQSIDDGAYQGVTLGSAGIGDGEACPEFDGINDYCDIYSAALNVAFDGDEGTAMIWAKVDGAARWTDGSTDNILSLVGDNGSTCVMVIRKSSTNNRLAFNRYVEVGYFKMIHKDGVSETGWMHLAVTWSAAADYWKAWYNGSLVDTALGIGSWSGPMLSTFNVIGASNTTPSNPFDGWLAHCAIWTTPLGSSEIAALAEV